MLNLLCKHTDLIGHHQHGLHLFPQTNGIRVDSSEKALTVEVHLDSLFQFLMSTCHGAQVRMLMLKTHRVQSQCGLGLFIFY